MTARPSTPFPHTHVLTHGHHGSYFSLTSPHAYTSQPIHFHMPALPSPTPPSLLKRQSSSGSNYIRHASVSSSSSSSNSRTPTSPRLIAPTPQRASSTRSSISSASLASPPMPTTPTLASPIAPPPSTPFSLPPPAYPKSTSPVEFRYDPYSTTLFSGEEIASLPTSSYLDERPVRPKLKRRDTPRPKTTTLGSLRMSGLVMDSEESIEEEEEERRVLRSVIDGGSWVILG
nr:uncharacterized protein CI109_001162 [Kwoniella shandongensis]KAA5530361.1 hypothetical protein CI109_001162 [Kwoniella shandongensis]